MPDDDEKKGAEAEYIPPDDRSKEIERRPETGQLPEVQLPPSGVIRSAFLTAIRYRSTAAAVAAYTSAVHQSAGAVRALADLDRAVLEKDRVTRLLEDAETIHEKDAFFIDTFTLSTPIILTGRVSVHFSISSHCCQVIPFIQKSSSLNLFI